MISLVLIICVTIFAKSRLVTRQKKKDNYNFWFCKKDFALYQKKNIAYAFIYHIFTNGSSNKIQLERRSMVLFELVIKCKETSVVKQLLAKLKFEVDQCIHAPIYKFRLQFFSVFILRFFNNTWPFYFPRNFLTKEENRVVAMYS